MGWVIIHSSPILYRYIDWSITVPLQMIEFYLILSAVKPDIGGGMFWRLLLGTIAMLAFGYAGEAGFLPPMMGFICGMCGWGFILFEIFMGEAGSVASGGVNEYVKSSFSTMRFIVTVGWSIYHLGYKRRIGCSPPPTVNSFFMGPGRTARSIQILVPLLKTTLQQQPLVKKLLVYLACCFSCRVASLNLVPALRFLMLLSYV